MENCMIGYLVHYCAPYTGAGEHAIPVGTKSCMYGPMRDDAMYMDIVGDVDSNLFEALKEKEKKTIPQLSTRITGFSFYITEEQMEELPLNFISGSRERCLEIFELIRQNDREFVTKFLNDNI